MTQENTFNSNGNNSTDISAMIHNVEERAEIIETGDSSGVKMNSFRLEDIQEVTETLKHNIQERKTEIQTDAQEIDEYIDSLSDDEKRSMYNAWKLTHRDTSKDKEDYVELKEAMEEPIHKLVIKRLRKANVPFYSNSNISEYITDAERESLIDEATEAFTTVLDTLVIDHKNDPNAMDTPRRLAKMYINELMQGRYYPSPKITAFPNTHTGKETGFSGLLVVRSEIVSMCSHHHQPVKGVVYIGIIPKDNVIGLSKYTRLVQWLARRGTLQEELAEDIADGIVAATGSENISVFVTATHGCCQYRGIMANDSTTQTTVLRGDFLTDGVLRKEFHDNIMFQELNKK